MRKNKLLVLICLLVFTFVLLSACENYSNNDSSVNSNDDVSISSSENTKSGNSKLDNDSGKRKLRFQ